MNGRSENADDLGFSRFEKGEFHQSRAAKPEVSQPSG